MKYDYRRYKNLKRGGFVLGPFDFSKKPMKVDWGWFKREGDNLVNTLAPITSELVGPVVQALTGVPVPNPKDLFSSDTAVSAKSSKQLEELGKKAFADLIDKGIPINISSKKGKGFKKLKA